MRDITNECAVQANNVKIEKQKGRTKEPLVKDNILGKDEIRIRKKIISHSRREERSNTKMLLKVVYQAIVMV